MSETATINTAAAASQAAGTATQSAAPVHFAPDGTLGENWFTALGDEFAPLAADLGKFKSVKDLAKSYAHFKRVGPAYPAADATPEDVARFRQLAQVPETPEGYGIAKPAELPEGIEWDDTAAASIAAVAHQHHVPAAALQAIVAKQLELEGQRAAQAKHAAETALQEAQNSLMQELQGNYEASIQKVRHLTDTLAGAAGITDANAVAAMSSNPAFVRMMLQVSNRITEDGVRPPPGFADLRSPRQKIDDIKAGKDKDWSDAYARGDQRALDHVAGLYKSLQ